MRALRANGAPLLQTAGAAGVAWFLAHDVLGHRSAFLAPIAALIALGLNPGKHTRRALEMVLGVAVGIAISDALISAIGRGPGQVALVVLLAMGAAILLGGGPLVVSQAASSAVIVATVLVPGNGILTARFIDALVGGGVGLAVLVLVPVTPVRLMKRAAGPVFSELAAVFDDVAAALGARDLAAVVRALERARATDGLLANLHHSVAAAEETVRLAPTQWSERARIERYVLAAPQIELAMRNSRVLARAAVRAVELEPQIPAGLLASMGDLATAVRRLGTALELDTSADGARESALKAAGEATAALEEGMGFAIDVLVGQVRATVTDLLRAIGVENAVEQVRRA